MSVSELRAGRSWTYAHHLLQIKSFWELSLGHAWVSRRGLERGFADWKSSLGLGFSKLMKFAHRKGLIDRESYVAQYLSLAIFTIGVVSSIGSDDLLAAFAAGALFFRILF